MLRKLLAVSTMALVMTSAACNSITGPAVNGDTNGIDRGEEPRQPVDVAPESPRPCLDIREMEIASPAEASIVRNGEFVMIEWQAEHFCAGFSSEVSVSLDGGQTFKVIHSGQNTTSAQWFVPNQDGLSPVVVVTVRDKDYELSDEHALGFIYEAGRPTGPGGRPDDLGD